MSCTQHRRAIYIGKSEISLTRVDRSVDKPGRLLRKGKAVCVPEVQAVITLVRGYPLACIDHRAGPPVDEWHAAAGERVVLLQEDPAVLVMMADDRPIAGLMHRQTDDLAHSRAGRAIASPTVI